MPANEELNDLVRRAQGGDEHALAELFERHRDRLGRMIYLRMDNRVQNRVAVSDVLQEAYVDLSKQLHNYAKDPKLPFFLWLRRITGQRLAKVHRAHLGQAKRDVAKDIRIDVDRVPDASSVFMAHQLAGEFTSASMHAVRNENEWRVQQAIESLTEHDREILALRHIEQLSNCEIATLLELSEPAATKRYTRAIRRLRDALASTDDMVD